MQNLLDELLKALKDDKRLLIDGRLAKNKIVELALSMDEGLITLLLKNKAIKKHFFTKVGETLVFDKVAFQSFVSNKQFLPDSYTAFKNKIGLTVNKEYLTESKEVVLSWPYKDCVLQGGQTKEDQKRDEIFWNETLAPDEIDRLLEPKTLTNFKKYDSKGEHAVKSISADDNLIIKGNNLLALHSLKKQYAGKIKLIYIDPPYNTNDDSFQYNDSFSHSTWLTFTLNRLQAAKELLTQDGFIFVQCNDIEHAYLKVLMDEVFGRDCFETAITVKMSHLSGTKMAHIERKMPKIKENILMYSKQGLVRLKPDYTEVKWEEAFDRYNSFVFRNNKPPEEWIITSLKKAMQSEGIDENQNPASALEFKINNCDKIFRTARNRGANYSKFPKNQFTKLADGGFTYKHEEVYFSQKKIRKFNGELKPSSAIGDIWNDIPLNDLANEGGVSLRFGKKPEYLLKRIISLCTNDNDIVLDFHLGSGTTCAVAHKMGRRYIGIEQLNYGKNDSVVRLNNVIKGDKSGISKDVDWKGGGSFIYCELSELNAQIINKIEKAKTTKILNTIWQEMQKSDFISHKVKSESINKSIKEFEVLSLDEQKQLLIAVLDKNQLYINYSEIDDKDYKISKEDNKLNKQFYGEA